MFEGENEEDYMGNNINRNNRSANLTIFQSTRQIVQTCEEILSKEQGEE